VWAHVKELISTTGETTSANYIWICIGEKAVSERKEGKLQ
jgi:hypothetical protein